MTRGNFVLITDDGIYASIQFNGDMYPSYNGKIVFHMLKNIHNKQELIDAIRKFDKKRFGYEECYGEGLPKLENWSDLDFSDSYFARFNSDYLYVKNASSKMYTIISRKGESKDILPEDVQIWHFGEYFSRKDESLELNDEEKREFGLNDCDVSSEWNDALNAFADELLSFSIINKDAVFGIIKKLKRA